MIKRLYWTASLVLIAAVALGACSSESTDEPQVDDSDKHDMAEKGKNYDSRFPIKLWIDENGTAHIDEDLNGGFPNHEAVVKAIAGKGWKLAKDYTNREYVGVSGKYFRFEESEFLGDWVGGDLDLKFYFDARGSYIHYYKWLPLFEGFQDSGEYYCAEPNTYTYDAAKGVLDCWILKSYKLVNIDEDNMWLVKTSVDNYFDLLYLKAVSPATLNEWNEKYTDFDKVTDLLNN
ncbi:MAG: hypothetical protein K2L99_07680 [Muribaculaceae bacterium]|nr:hypothetical protein [Muribaculaceae bacterium]